MGKYRVAIVGASGFLLLAASAVTVGWLLKRGPEEGCYGFTRMSSAAELLGADALSTEQRGDAPPLGHDGTAYCKMAVPSKGVSIHAYFDRGAKGGKLLTKLDRYDTDDSRKHVSPIGNEWRGVVNPGPAFMRGAVSLRCSGDLDDNLTVSVVAYSPSAFDRVSRTELTKFARFTTDMAKEAGSEWGCQKGFGKRVESLPRGYPDGVSTGLPSQGTCEGVQPPSFGTAAVPEAPVEDCIIVDGQGNPQFRLAAYYGPFVNAARTDTFRSDRYSGKKSGGRMGFYWLSGRCPTGPALYSVETLDSEDGVSNRKPDLQKAALDVFARRSAESRGCTLVR